MTRVAIAIDAPQYAGMSSLLTYESEQALVPGTLARVPLGRREVTGLVWDADFAAVDAAAVTKRSLYSSSSEREESVYRLLPQGPSQRANHP